MKSPESGFCLSHISQVPWLLRTLQLTASVNIHICRLGLDSIAVTVAQNQSKLSFNLSNVSTKHIKNPTKTLQMYLTLCCFTLRALIKANIQRTHSLVHKNTSVWFLPLLNPSKSPPPWHQSLAILYAEDAQRNKSHAFYLMSTHTCTDTHMNCGMRELWKPSRVE